MGTGRQAVLPTATTATTRRRHRRRQHSRRPVTFLPAHRSPPPLSRLLPSLKQRVWLGKRYRRPPLSAAHIPSHFPVAAAVGAVAASRSGCRWEREHEGDQRYRDDRPPPPQATTQSSAVHLPDHSPVAAAFVAAAAFSLLRLRLGGRFHRPPPPRRAAVVNARKTNTDHGRSLPHRLPFAAVVAAAAFSQQRIRLGKRYRRPPLPAAHVPHRSRSPPPLPRLLPSNRSGYGEVNGTSDRRCRHDRLPPSPTTAMSTSAQPRSRSPLTAPVGAAAASRSGCHWERGDESDHRRCDDWPPPPPATTQSSTAHPPNLSAVAAVAMAAAFSSRRIRLGKRYQRPPRLAAHLLPRPPVAAAVATAAAIL